MTESEFDKKIREELKKISIPDHYYERVEEVLRKIEEEDVVPAKKKRHPVRAAAVILVVLLVGSLAFSATRSQAGFMNLFTQNLLTFLGVQTEDSERLGIDSQKQESTSKPDLMMELQEVVMDTQNIYAIVKITAPPSVIFDKKMSFDYFGFCEGSNFNAANVVAGARSCELLEVSKEKKNVATFVVNVVTDEQIKEGKEVCIFFQNLIADPTKTEPDVVVEGLWNLNFRAEYTESKDITIDGTKDMSYPFLDTTATVKKIKILPLGMTLKADVSNVPREDLGISDTRISVRLKMADGKEVIVQSPDPDVKEITSGGSIVESEKGDKTYLKYVSQFEKAIDINQIVGVYIEELYVPIRGE